MTKELKPHQIAQLVNKLRDIATKYHAHGCLRELISREVNAALTQRPAAQAVERDAFESAARAKWGQLYFERSEAVPEMYYNQRLDDAWIGFGFAVAWLRASLPTQPAAQATPEPGDDAQIRAIGEGLRSAHDHIEMHRLERSHCKDAERIREGLAAFSAYKKRGDFAATPEPVGEPFGYFRALPFGWEQCGEHDEGAVALYTRPAPGVPEGFTLDQIADACIEAEISDGKFESLSIALAAAQANGGCDGA